MLDLSHVDSPLLSMQLLWIYFNYFSSFLFQLPVPPAVSAPISPSRPHYFYPLAFRCAAGSRLGLFDRREQPRLTQLSLVPPSRPSFQWSLLSSTRGPSTAAFFCLYLYRWFREGNKERSFHEGGPRCRWDTGLVLTQNDHPVTFTLSFSNK